MTPKLKYILSAIAGFLAIFLIGIAAIKLMKAKRSTAPEADISSLTNTLANVEQKQNTQGSAGEAAKLTPFAAEESAVAGTFADLPADVQKFFPNGEAGLTIYKVTYVEGGNGYRIERDVPGSVFGVHSGWKNYFDGWRFTQARFNQHTGLLQVENDTYIVQVSVNAITNVQVGELVRILDKAS